jgi:hypothetical protein
MIKKSEIRDGLKDKIRDYMIAEGVHSRWTAQDMMVKETFFYIFHGLKNGDTIYSLGRKLGFLPMP